MQKGCVLLERGASPAGRWWLLLGGCRELFLGGGVFVWLLLVREKGGFSAGKMKEKKGLRGETREGSFLSSFWREDIFEKENQREREERKTESRVLR